MHCRLLGKPGRIGALQRFLDHIEAHDRVWVCRRIDIARHWKATHPFARIRRQPDNGRAARSRHSTPRQRRRIRARCWPAPTSTRRGSSRRAAAQPPVRDAGGAEARAGRGGARGAARAAAGADPRAPRAGRQGDGQPRRSPPSRRTSRARPASPSARPRSSRASSSSTPTTTRSSASRSSWQCAGRAAPGWASARSSPPSRAAWPTTRTSSSPSACATSTASPRSGSTTSSASCPTLGNLILDWAEALAEHSDPGFAERGELTVTYLTDAHRACARSSSQWMREDCGFDEVRHRCGRQRGRRLPRQRPRAPSGCSPAATTTPCATAASTTAGSASSCRWPACASCSSAGQRLPFGIEVVGFAEEEGQRYKAVFLGSGALTGHFDPRWLDQTDADGVTMRDAMQQRRAWRSHDIAKLKRDPSRYLGFVEVHIEQGPVLNELDLPLGIVTSINGSVRYLCEITGMASHAGTTPMDMRRDAAAAAAELVLYLEQRASSEPEPGGHGGHAAGAQRLDQRGARALRVQPRHPRHHRRSARRLRARRAGRAARDLPAPRPALARSRKPSAPPLRRARRRGRRAGSAPCERSACRCAACPAVPATTR